MSIDARIKQLLDDERLYLVQSVFDSDEAARTILISPEVHRLIEGPWPTPAWETRGNKLRADLESFASGAEISVCVTPFEAREEDLALLDPPDDGVWDWRSREPAPGLRLLGHFIRRDTFVLLIPAMRSVASIPPDFVPRGPLENQGSIAWRHAIRDTRAAFRSLFLPFQPIPGDNLQDVLSSGYDQSRDHKS